MIICIYHLFTQHSFKSILFVYLYQKVKTIFWIIKYSKSANQNMMEIQL